MSFVGARGRPESGDEMIPFAGDTPSCKSSCYLLQRAFELAMS